MKPESHSTMTIHPLDLGTLVDFDKSIFTLRHNQGVKLDVPCLAYLIQGGRKAILVDTGPCNADFAVRYHRTLRKEPAQEVPNALGKLGVPPDQIDLVILTHLHWDHCFNLEHFPNASFVVQKKELEYAAAPLPADRGPYEAFIPGIRPPWMEVFGRITPVEGDVEIVEGVRLLHLPGHTPGFQGVSVETGEGPWVIAGDTIPLFENWGKDATSPKTPGGIYQDLFSYYDTLERLKTFGDKILPGHDPRVLDHSEYPVGNDQTPVAGR